MLSLRGNHYMQHAFVQRNSVLRHGCIDSGLEQTENVHRDFQSQRVTPQLRLQLKLPGWSLSRTQRAKGMELTNVTQTLLNILR